jgi:hypothetical protein
MLKSVRIWYELWREFNGFPPEYISELEAATTKADSKSEAKSDSKDMEDKK